MHTNNSTLCNIEGQLILALIRKLAKLYALHFRPNKRCDLIDISLALGKQVGERSIGVLSMVVMLK